MNEDDATTESAAARKGGGAAFWIPLSGFCLFAVLLILPPPGEMPLPAWRVAAVGLFMAFLWVTEALPVAVTALLPLILFPLLGIAPLGDAAAPYADPIIFLFLGGLMLGLALQKWELHRRIALVIVSRVGLRPGRLVLGFMIATAFIGLWVSNTATAAMMLPVTISMVTLLVGSPDTSRSAPKGQRDLVLALLLGVAFAASIGGMGTLIGTPPNALFAGYMRRTHGIEIGFAQWMMLGVPIGSVLLLGTWLILTRIVFRVPSSEAPGMRERLAQEMAQLPRMSRPEKLVGAVFVATAAAWVFRPLLAAVLPGLDDTVIAVAAAFALFLIPSGRGGFLMDWKTAAGLPWDVLILFGGGLSLAAAIGASGLSSWIGQSLAGFGTMPTIVLVLAVVLVTIALSELTSNTATTAAFLPLAGSIGVALDLDPLTLTVPVVLAASCGYMLPVATPPNALFYGSGYMTVAQMVKAGALVDLLGAALVAAASYGFATMVF